MRTTPTLCAGFVFATYIPAASDTFQVICENPRREYVVSITEGNANLKLSAEEGLTLYRILAVENTDARYVVVALTTDNGPTVRFSLRPYMRMEFWSGSELMQTDACRAL